MASGSDEDPVSVPALTGAMVKIQSVAKGSRKQCSKYATIAIGFHCNGLTTSYLKFLSKEYGVDIGVTHLSNPRLLKLDRSGMVLGIQALSAFLSPANTPKKQKRGTFPDFDTRFFDMFTELYNTVSDAAVKNYKEVDCDRSSTCVRV